MAGAKFSGRVTLNFENVDLDNSDIVDEEELRLALSQAETLTGIIDYREEGTIACTNIEIVQFIEAEVEEDDEEAEDANN